MKADTNRREVYSAGSKWQNFQLLAFHPACCLSLRTWLSLQVRGKWNRIQRFTSASISGATLKRGSNSGQFILVEILIY